MLGVVRAPSAFSMTRASLALGPSMTATHEFVVPRSIPMTLLINTDSFQRRRTARGTVGRPTWWTGCILRCRPGQGPEGGFSGCGVLVRPLGDHHHGRLQQAPV